MSENTSNSQMILIIINVNIYKYFCKQKKIRVSEDKENIKLSLRKSIKRI